MKRVTDPKVLAELNAPSGTLVTDPDLLAELNAGVAPTAVGNKDSVTPTGVRAPGSGVTVTLEPEGDEPPPQEPTQPEPKSGFARAAQNVGYGLGDIVEGAGNIPGMLIDPAVAAMNWATGAPVSKPYGARLRESMGLPQNPNPVSSAISKGGASALTGSGIAGLVRGATTGVTSEVARQLATAPIMDTISGGLSGLAGEKAHEAKMGPVFEVAASLLGGLTPVSAVAAAKHLALPRGALSQVAQAAQRQGVDLMAADVGGPSVKMLTAGAKQGFLSAGPVTAKAENTMNQLHAAASRTADAAGTVLPEDTAGSALQKAGEVFSKATSQFGGRMYDRAEKLAGDARIVPEAAITALNGHIAKLQEAGKVAAPAVKELTKYLTSLSQEGGITVNGARQIRTLLRKGWQTDALRNTDAQRIMKDVGENLSNDVTQGLAANGTEEGAKAANAFKAADAFWRTRVETIDKILEPVIGASKSGEDVINAVESMARGKTGGVQRLRGLLGALPGDEANDVRATLIDRLGRSAPGVQNETGTAFSPATFATNWAKMSEAGKNALFGHDPKLRNNLDDIVLLTSKVKGAQRYANTSNTAGAAGVQAVMSGSTFAAGAAAGHGVLGGIGAMVGSAVLQTLSAHALASKALTDWILRAPRIGSARAFDSYIGQLKSIALREPAIAADISQLHDALTQSAPSSPSNPEDDKINFTPGFEKNNGSSAIKPTAQADLPISQPQFENLVGRVIQQESGGDPNAVSNKGAKGLMQVMHHTGFDPGMGVMPMRNDSPEENMRFGRDYLAALLKRYDDVPTALAAYNWGLGNVDEWIAGGRKGELPEETQAYIRNIVSEGE